MNLIDFLITVIVYLTGILGLIILIGVVVYWLFGFDLLGWLVEAIDCFLNLLGGK